MGGGELAALLRERAKVGVMSWPAGVVLSVGLHAAFLGTVVLCSKVTTKAEDVKVIWVNLPAAGGTSGGSGPTALGEEGERNRRVDDVAPQQNSKGSSTDSLPDYTGKKGTKAPAKGDNPDSSSMGRGRTAAKGKNPNPSSTPGAAGQGGGGGIGIGSGIPGLKASGGAEGGTGLVGGLDGANFPYLWYLQWIQNKVTSNWTRMSTNQGRVLIYFRIRRNGSVEGVRIETESGNPGLDQSAILAVRRSDPLPKLPDGFEGDSLGVHFWFTYVGN